MDQKITNVAFIPLRGGSKSIPLKNIKLIAGRPLVYWVLDAATRCKFIDMVYISSDNEKINQTIKQYAHKKIRLIHRSVETATDDAKTESVMIEFAQKNFFENIVLIQATSPLLEYIHLEEGLLKYFTNNADSMLSVVVQKRFIWDKDADGTVKPKNYFLGSRPRRQNFDGFLVENGAFYITNRDNLLKTGLRISGKIFTYEMPEETYHELDENVDWYIIETLLLNRENKKVQIGFREKLKGIKMLITDVDGVLTDAGMYYSENGDEIKKFNTRDGKGIELLKLNGIKTAVLTGEKTKIVSKRCKKLKIDYVYQGVKNKNIKLNELSDSSGIQEKQME